MGSVIFDPNMDFVVYDQSIPEDELESPSIDSSLGALFATFSSRGRHNKIIECRTRGAIMTTFGDDFVSFSKYGQANLMAMRTVMAGGRAFICSLLPDDAKVAYSVFGVKTRIDTVNTYLRSDTVISADGTHVESYGSGAYILDQDGERKKIMLKAAAGDSVATVEDKIRTVVIATATKELQSNYFDENGNPTVYDGEPIKTSTESNAPVDYDWSVSGKTNVATLTQAVNINGDSIEGTPLDYNQTKVKTDQSKDGNTYKIELTGSLTNIKDWTSTSPSQQDGKHQWYAIGFKFDGTDPTKVKYNGTQLTEDDVDETGVDSFTVNVWVKLDEIINTPKTFTFERNGVVDTFSASFSTETESVTPETNEEIFWPLFTLYYYGAGRGGNFFAYRVSRSTDRDRQATDGRRYKITFYEILSSGSYKALYDGEEFEFSFNPDSVYSDADDTKEYIGNVYTNIDSKGDDNVLQLIAYKNTFEKLTEYLIANGVSDENSKVDIDFLNCLNKNGNSYTSLVLDDDTIDLANTYIRLSGGTDGSLEVSDTNTEEDVAKVKENLLNKFFQCDVDNLIFDEKMVDADIVADANYPDSVKKTILSEFSQYRPDISLAIDCGINSSHAEALAKMRELSRYVNSEWSYFASFFGPSGNLNDIGITADRSIKVTGTYDYLGGLAANFATASGAFQMHAGANRGRVRYMIPHWIAVKDKANTIETLELQKLNHIQYLNKQKEQMWGLESSQYEIETSKLMSNRNALVIGRLIRMCAGILPYYKYDERNINTTMEAAKAALVNAVSAARIPATIVVGFDLYQTKADRKSENAHCAISVQFPDYVKKFHVVITARRQTVSEE